MFTKRNDQLYPSIHSTVNVIQKFKKIREIKWTNIYGKTSTIYSMITFIFSKIFSVLL